MITYGPPIYLSNGNFDGYDSIEVNCDQCGEDCSDKYETDDDREYCPDCYAKLLEEEWEKHKQLNPPC